MKHRFAPFLLLAGLVLRVPAAETAISPETPALLQQQLDAAVQSGLKKIVIPPGIYRLAGPDQKERSWHLQFKDLRDLEIDATGATFIFTHPVHYGILFSGCSSVYFNEADESGTLNRVWREPNPFL